MSRYRQTNVQRNLKLSHEAPVAVAATAILLDEMAGKDFAQIKYLSLSPREIASLGVRVVAHTADGEAVPVELHVYRDLGASFGDEFGSSELIELPNRGVCDFSVQLIFVEYHDKSRWEPEENFDFVSLSPLTDSSTDKDLLIAYKKRLSGSARFTPVKSTDYWICSCGAANQSSSETCGACGNAKGDVLAILDSEALSDAATRWADEEKRRIEAEEEATRLAAEEARRERAALLAQEEEERARSEAEEKKRQEDNARFRKQVKTAAIIVAAAAAAYAFIARPIMTHLENQSTYQSAVEKLQSGSYQSAYSAFESLGDYQDADSLEKKAAVKVADQIVDKGGADIMDALDWYDKGNDPSGKERAFAGMYKYVKDHFDNQDETTLSYLEHLKDESYSDSANLYQQLYEWHVEFALCSSRDYKQNGWMDSATWTRTDQITGVTLLVRATGGKPGETLEYWVDIKERMAPNMLSRGEWRYSKAEKYADPIEIKGDGEVYSFIIGFDNYNDAFKVELKQAGPDSDGTVITKEIYAQ